MQGKGGEFNRKFATGPGEGNEISPKKEWGEERFFVCSGIDTCSIGFYNRGNEKTYIKGLKVFCVERGPIL